MSTARSGFFAFQTGLVGGLSIPVVAKHDLRFVLEIWLRVLVAAVNAIVVPVDGRVCNVVGQLGELILMARQILSVWCFCCDSRLL